MLIGISLFPGGGGFGSPPSFGGPAFGGAPKFGSGAAFGGQPAFGSGATFGSAPTFGSSAGGSTFGSASPSGTGGFARWVQGSHRLEKYLNLEGFLVKSLNIRSALKSTGKSLKSLEKSLNSTIFCRT